MMNKITGILNGVTVTMAVNQAHEGLFFLNEDGRYEQLLGTGQFRDLTGNTLKREIRRRLPGIGRAKYDMRYFSKKGV